MGASYSSCVAPKSEASGRNILYDNAAPRQFDPSRKQKLIAGAVCAVHSIC